MRPPHKGLRRFVHSIGSAYREHWFLPVSGGHLVVVFCNALDSLHGGLWIRRDLVRRVWIPPGFRLPAGDY